MLVGERCPTYSLAAACTQNLCGTQDSPRSVSVEAIAGLFRDVAAHYIVDMASRLGMRDSPQQYFFDGLVFGYCPVAAGYKAFRIGPSVVDGMVQIEATELPLDIGTVHAIGSGREEFGRLYVRAANASGVANPISVLKEMLRSQAVEDVGGHIQFGMDDNSGFRILPIVIEEGDPRNWPTTFLGWDSMSASPINGYTIGYRAVGFGRRR